ncbi:MAG: ABC transporter substrate-binding protein [Gammaproteobacteria bacterium]
MLSIQLGFKAFDIHELLCHFMASKAGLYEQAGLQVELIDITFMADADLPPHTFQVSCGSALISALKGIPQRIIFVATEKPMFWIYSNRKIKDLPDLRNKKVASYPDIAPPCHLAKIILKQAGLDPTHDVIFTPARDDVARLGLLKCGAVDAAMISSAILPPKVKQRAFSTLCFFGDKIKLPTTGLAVHRSQLEREPESARTLVSVLKESLNLIHNNPVLLGNVLQDFFDIGSEIQKVSSDLIRACFTRDGQITGLTARGAVDLMGDILNVTPAQDWNQIYGFSLSGD